MCSDTIVVGIDGSEGSIGALRWAAETARRLDAPLHLVHAGRVPLARAGTGSTLDVVAPQIQARGDSVLDAVIEAAASALRGVAVVPVVVAGHAAGSAMVAGAEGAALLVVGARGHSQHTLRLGSVSEHCLRYARCPVVVVPAQTIDSAGPVIVGIDGSAESVGVLQWALTEAGRRGVAVHAVAVYLPYPEGRPFGAEYMEAAHPGTLQRLRAAASQGLDEALSNIQGAHPEVEVQRSVLEGKASDVLTEVAEHASLLVVGARGQGAVLGRLLGSVSHAVARNARCPVAVIRPR